MGKWQQMGLKCDYCHDLSDWSEWDMVGVRETAKRLGWKRTLNGKDKCPECIKNNVIIPKSED